MKAYLTNRAQYRQYNLILLSKAKTLLTQWLPGGHIEGNEYVALNPTRQDRTKGSFRIHLRTGKWSDFATGDRGGDLIALYAYIKGIKQSEALNELLRLP